MSEETTLQNVTTEPVADIDGYIDTRQQFIEKVNTIFVDGKDYHVIQGKKSMAKGGAEKLASIFGWHAKFARDTESIEMLGDVDGLVAFVCDLTKNGEFVGQGRGAAILSKNANDPNKTLKMAQKSAFIDAVLRTSGLSDFFTQDLEDMRREDIGEPANADAFKPTDKQLKYIADLAKAKGLTKEDVEKMLKEHPTASDVIETLKEM